MFYYEGAFSSYEVQEWLDMKNGALGFVISFRMFLGKQAKVEAEAMKQEEEKEEFLSILEEKRILQLPLV